MVENLMITENRVVDRVVLYLESIGFLIESTCSTMEKGVDIVAKKDSKRLSIEAKGSTTSKDTSRKGKPFSRNQITNHISRAIFKALQMKECEAESIIAIALPYTKTHLQIIETVEKALNNLEIITIWCYGANISVDGNDRILAQLK